jgi:hypothetical protein
LLLTDNWSANYRPWLRTKLTTPPLGDHSDVNGRPLNEASGFPGQTLSRGSRAREFRVSSFGTRDSSSSLQDSSFNPRAWNLSREFPRSGSGTYRARSLRAPTGTSRPSPAPIELSCAPRPHAEPHGGEGHLRPSSLRSERISPKCGDARIVCRDGGRVEMSLGLRIPGSNDRRIRWGTSFCPRIREWRAPLFRLLGNPKSTAGECSLKNLRSMAHGAVCRLGAEEGPLMDAEEGSMGAPDTPPHPGVRWGSPCAEEGRADLRGHDFSFATE